MAVGDAHVFPGFLTPVLTLIFFPTPPTTFLTCFCRGERRRYAGNKVRLNRGSNAQSPGHEYDTLTTKPPGRGNYRIDNPKIYWKQIRNLVNINRKSDSIPILRTYENNEEILHYTDIEKEERLFPLYHLLMTQTLN